MDALRTPFGLRNPPRRRPFFLLMLAMLLALGASVAQAAEITFLRAYQGNLSGQTFTTTTQLNADAGSVRFSDGSGQHTFNNTNGTLYYTVGGVPHAESGTLRARYPNGSVRIDAVAFDGSGGFRLLVLGGAYAGSGSYGGSSNGIVDRLNEYIGETAPDPIQTTLQVNGGSTATVPVGGTATITVAVRLSSGSPLSGATVSLAGTPSGTSSISPASVLSDASGLASFTVQGLASGTVSYRGTATASGTTTQTNNAVSVIYTAPRSPALSSATVPDGTAGSPTSLTITVRDINGTPVPGAGASLGATMGGSNAGASVSAVVDHGNGTYTVTYVPASAGVDTVAITLDGTPIGGSPYSSTVAAPPVVVTVAPAAGALPGSTQGAAYQQAFTASGGTGPYSFVVSAGALPAGLSIASNGELTGTPTQAGSYAFTVTATDANGVAGSAGYTLNVAAPVAVTVAPAAGALPGGTQGAAYQLAFTASGGTGPYSFVVSAGALPAGLSIASNGELTGTPTQAGSYAFTVTATDVNGVAGSAGYTLNVAAPVVVTLSPAPGALPGGVQGAIYQHTFSASGGTGAYSFVVSSGTLPAGLSMAPNGDLSGTPTQAGSFSFTVTARDANDVAGSAGYTLNITAPVMVVVSPATGPLPDAAQGAAYSQTFAASGGSGPYGFTLGGGALPSGLSVAQNGDLSGTPTQAGSFSFTVTATDANGVAGSASYVLEILAPAVVTLNPAAGALDGGRQGAAYHQVFTAAGGAGPYGFVVSGGALPAGLALSPAGVLAGMPTQAGSFSFTVTVTDATGLATTAGYTLEIAAPVEVVVGPSAGSLGEVVSGAAYQQTFTASGGTAPYRFTVSEGSLPPGLTLSPDGVLMGVPSQSGGYAFTVTVTDANGRSTTVSYVLEIAAPVEVVVGPTAGSLGEAVSGAAYQQTFTASGGTAPYRFTISEGSLPPGLALSEAGELTGTPTEAGRYTFTVTVTDADGRTTTASYVLEIAAPVQVVVSPVAGALEGATRGAAYQLAVTASGGSEPYTFALGGGALPTGLALSAAGVLAGTPTQAGRYAFTLSVADANGVTASADYVLEVAMPERPDPTLDREVLNLQAAQVQAAARLASMQIGNVRDRLDQLRGDACRRSSVRDIRLGLPIDARPAPRSDSPVPTATGDAAAAAPSVPDEIEATDEAPAECGNTATWIGGAVNLGRARNGAIDLKQTLVGVSGGIDRRFTPNIAGGIGMGYGRERADIGQSASRSEADAVAAFLYGSVRFDSPLFFNAMLGYQRLDFDSRRAVEATGAVAQGSRSGRQAFGAATFGYEFDREGLLLSSYGRIEATRTELDAFAESGADMLDLAFGRQTTEGVAGVLGLSGEHVLTRPWGDLTARWRGEYTRSFIGATYARLGYADMDSLPYVLRIAAYRDRFLAAGFGLEASFRSGATLGLDYSAGSSLDGHSTEHRVDVRMGMKF